MKNTIKQEQNDWMSISEPEEDSDYCYYTSTPVLIYKMVDDNLEVSNTISQEIVQKTLQLSINQVIKFGGLYQAAAREYKENYLVDRTTVAHFTKYLIAIVNNCEKFVSLGQETRTRWWKPGHLDADSVHSFENLIKIFEDIKEEIIMLLLDQAFVDIEQHFEKLFTENWKAESEALENIFDKLNIDFENYHRLKTVNYHLLFSSIQERLASQYVSAMFRRRIVFPTEEERKVVVAKVHEETQLAREFFIAVGGHKINVEIESPFRTIDDLLSVVGADEEMVSFELMMLNSKYSDLTEDHIVCLLLLRGLSRTDAKQTATEINQEADKANKTLQTKSILSHIQVSLSLIDKLTL